MLRRRIGTLSALMGAFLFAAAFTPSSVNNATEWVIDASHSKIGFEIRHFFTPVPGSFDSYDAIVYFSPDNLENSSINVTIDVNSINTANERRDGHLLSKDFFNAEQWGTIRFTSSEIKSAGGNDFIAVGELTIRDVTKSIELPFTLLGVMSHPFREGTKVAGITSDLKINRNDYGVGTGDWAATAVVGDEVTIDLNLELNTK